MSPYHTQKTYGDKLKDPRWQKRRLEIFTRDEWTCQECFDTESTLHVHHLWYENDKELWEIESRGLLTLCELCHASETERRPVEEQRLLLVLKRAGFLSEELMQLAAGFHLMHDEGPGFGRQVTAGIIAWMLEDRDRMHALIRQYFSWLAEHRKNGTLKFLRQRQEAN